MDVVIDTDIIYYLCNKSSDCHFDKNKFLNDMKSNNWNIGITYYSLFEIMNKFSLRQANKDFEGILNFLINNDFGIILDSNLDASSYNILTKCLNKSKKEYYRKKFRNALVPYMAGTLSGFSILFASFWISIISKNEKLYNSEYEQTKRWATENLDKLKNTINNIH